MCKRWLAGMLAGWLAAAARADDPIPLDPLPLTPISAALPANPKERPDRPTELPNLDPRTDLPLLPRQPANPAPPARPRRNGPPSNYDPSYLYLPERNPGLRQPPCPCLPLGTWWFDGSYFLGKTQNASTPNLLTQGGSGLPGTPGVNVLQGNDRIDHPFRSGLRLETGLWLDRCQNWGVESSFFFMESNLANFSTASPGDPLLARPFTQQPGNVPAADVIASPGVSRGWAFVNSGLSFQGADVNSRLNMFCEDRVRLDFLAGYRFIRMSESLNIHSYSETFGGTAAGSVREAADNFHTLNLFNGGQIGFAGEYRFDRFYIAGATKIAFGVNWHRLDINGWTSSPAPGGGVSSTVPSGLLAQNSNSGAFYESRFAVAPEANFTVGCQLGDHWRAFLGYTFIYVSSVARPGQAIDPNVGTTALGAVLPALREANTDFWMHGINFGLEARY